MTREPEDIHAALAALADGTLPEELRESLLARVAETPELAAELEDQRRAVMLVGSLERIETPTLLRRSIELAVAGDTATTGGERRSRSRSVRLPSRLIAGVAIAAAVVVVLVLVLTTGGGTSAPTVLQASDAGLRSATGAAPAENPHNPHLLAASAVGISYPYWGGRLGWNAAGTRTDTVGGRTVTTVFYANSRSRRIGYSIVAGPALAIPSGGTTVEHGGVSFHVISHASPAIVTWREAGHTCILTARGVSIGTLMRLATWRRA